MRSSCPYRSHAANAIAGAGWLLWVVAVLLLASGCEARSHHKRLNAATGGTASPTLVVALDRDPNTTPYNVIITATLTTNGSTPAPGVAVSISATGGTAGAVTDQGDGTYTATVVPGFPSGEVPITVQASLSGKMLQQQRIALVLPTVDPSWGQPEAVRGSVNTAGYEDGPNISPDGQWLVVTDTSPIDAVCCITGCGGPVDSQSAYCQTVVGPDSYGAPLRPNFPGAWRVVDSTHVLNMCPKLCLTSDFTATGGQITNPASAVFPPVASYLFKRQPDGSFGEPQFVGYDADGCDPPTGISFDGTPTATTANLVFDWGDPTVPGHTQLYWSAVSLGATNILGTCSCGTSSLLTVNNFATALNLGYTQTNSNPSFHSGVLAFDNEGATPDGMYFAVASGTLPTATFTPNGEPYPAIAVGNPAEDHSQPYYWSSANTLIFSKAPLGIFTSILAPSGDPANAGDWGPEVPLLLEETSTSRTGAITAVGQGTIATLASGKNELYFVYIMLTSINGIGTNANIGVIPKR